jgi:hypothetical protein
LSPFLNKGILEIYHTILTALDSKFFTSITFADVSKAFDRVWIGGLLLKLERYGIKGDLLIFYLHKIIMKLVYNLRVRICRRF